MKITGYLVIIFLFLITALNAQNKNRKVLLIGIDGLQFEQIAKTKTPNFDKFTIKRAFTGGVTKTATEQVTSSGPSWMTILTGVWVDQHKIVSNSSNQHCKYPSVFQRIRKENGKAYTASISTWKNINLLLYQDMYGVNFSTQGGTDKKSVAIAVSEIKSHAPDFLFIHLDDIDHAGHASGFGDKYNRAIREMDANLGKLLTVVKKREEEQNEAWLVILVTDHGRGKGGYGHGNQTVQEKTVFIGLNLEGNNYFKNQDNSLELKNLKEVEKIVPQTAVVPTILKYLNIPIKKEWLLDAVPLID